MIFFHTNNEKRIGWKKLSQADLGLSPVSHQSHIGLYEDVLTFLDDSDVIKTAMLFYGDYCDILNCSFDRIQNPDGSFRSPKIRVGQSSDSIVAKIREFAATDPSADWYLIWVGLDSNELVFWLIKSGTKDYATVKDVFFRAPRVITPSYDYFNNAVSILENRINEVSSEIQKDLEIASQTKTPRRTYRPRDLENAERLFKTIGKAGETMIAEYLDKKKSTGEISSYLWMNKDGESGAPFDFVIDESLSTENFIDVKSTRFGFDQQIIFSSQEVGFIDSVNNDIKYSVFRVYDIQEIETKLRICNHCLSYMARLNSDIVSFKNTIEPYKAVMTTATLAIDPTECFSRISEPILLKMSSLQH